MIIVTVALIRAGTETNKCRVMLDSGDTHYNLFDNRGALDWYLLADAHCSVNYETLMKKTRAYIDVGGTSITDNAGELIILGFEYADTLQRYYPDSAQAYFLKALASAKITRLKWGFQRIKLAKVIEGNVKISLKLDPSFAPAWVLLGGYYREVASANDFLKVLARIFFGKIPEGTLYDAEDALRKAIALSPENVYANLELARTIAAGNSKEQAIKILEKMQDLPLAWYGDSELKNEGIELLKELRK